MKKVRIIILFMTLFLGMLFLTPVKVFGAFSFEGTAEDWFNHISQFDYDDNGIAYCVIFKSYVDGYDEKYGLLVVEEPFHEFDGWFFEYDYSEDLNYFEPWLGNYIKNRLIDDFWEDIVERLESAYTDFDGFLYWNFEEQYWQVEAYGTSELDYYRQRVDDLEDEIQDLENEIDLLEDEISLLEDEIQDLENEISLLENEIQNLENEIGLLEDEIQDLEDEIQQLEEALDFEYERGYNEGYQIGYNEGLLVENNDITKWFVPLVVVIIVVGIIEPIIILKRRG